MQKNVVIVSALSGIFYKKLNKKVCAVRVEKEVSAWL